MQTEEPLRTLAAGKIQLKKLKKSLENNLFWRMNRSLVTAIAIDGFRAPSNPKVEEAKNAIDQASTNASSDKSEPNGKITATGGQNQVSYNKNELINSAIAAGDKKLKTVLHMMLAFEDNCISNHSLDKKQLRTFRMHSRGLLGKVLENYVSVRAQQADSLGIVILLISAIKLGMSKKKFISSIKSIARRKKVTIDAIRKTKCYSVVKKIITQQD